MRRTAVRGGRLVLVAAALPVTLAGGAGLALADTGSRETAPPASTATPSGEPVPGTPCTTSADACVDLTSHTAWLLEEGKVKREVPFLDGDPRNPTPVGTFAVDWKAQNYHSREFDADMPFSVFFAPGGIAFHEGSLDNPSAGCVHLEKSDAVAFFDRLAVGDQVQVRGEHRGT